MSREKAFSANRSRRAALSRAAGLLGVAALLLVVSACASSPYSEVSVQSLVFQADPVINGGQLLPVDVIYVTYLQDLRKFTSLGPDQWFQSPERAEWPARESFGITGGETVRVDLNPVLLDRTSYLLVFTNYKNVTNPSPQQVVLDASANSEETILVHAQSLEPLNPALREPY
ncbi:MAG: hypothetical protein KQJ78_08255 [Deltaproteobacteria bacterium]|nr:hypothetical protein [Deltaproteobacteria bacterium]